MCADKRPDKDETGIEVTPAMLAAAAEVLIDISIPDGYDLSDPNLIRLYRAMAAVSNESR